MKLKNIYNSAVIQRGKNYQNKVLNCIKKDNYIEGFVSGGRRYKTKVNLDNLSGDCSCPYETNCKHAVALYLVYKSGKFTKSDDIKKNLKGLSKDELINIIINNIEDLTKLNKKINQQKTFGKNKFDESMLKLENFNLSTIEFLDENCEKYSFDSLLKLAVFLDKNYDELEEKMIEEQSDKIEEDYNYYDNYGYDEEENPYYDLQIKVKRLLFDRISSKTELEKIFRIDLDFENELISNSDKYFEYKDMLKKKFDKKIYFQFLLNCDADKVSIDEIIKLYNKNYLNFVIRGIETNLRLVQKLKNHISDEIFQFILAVELKDLDKTVELFKSFEEFDFKVFKTDNFCYRVPDKFYCIDKFVGLLKKKNYNNSEFLKKIFEKYYKKQCLFSNDYYDRNNLNENGKYLISNLNDINLMKKILNQRCNWDAVKTLIKRLTGLDTPKAIEEFFRQKKLFSGNSDQTFEVILFCKNNFGKNYLVKLLMQNKESLKNASHLKNRLKEKGINISYRKGELDIKF